MIKPLNEEAADVHKLPRLQPMTDHFDVAKASIMVHLATCSEGGTSVIGCANGDALIAMKKALADEEIIAELQKKNVNIIAELVPVEDDGIPFISQVHLGALLIACEELAKRSEFAVDKWASLLVAHSLNCHQEPETESELLDRVMEIFPPELNGTDELGIMRREYTQARKIEHEIMEIINPKYGEITSVTRAALNDLKKDKSAMIGFKAPVCLFLIPLIRLGLEHPDLPLDSKNTGYQVLNQMVDFVCEISPTARTLFKGQSS